MAEIALHRGAYLVAAQEYLSLSQQSKNPEFARRSTELAYEYGFDSYALSSAERWVALEPDNTDAHSYLGRLYVRRDYLDKAWDSFDIALGPAADRSDAAYVFLATDLGEYAQPERGMKVFEKFNEVYPEVPGITASVSALAAQANDIDRAVEAARETVRLAPEWTRARVWLARFLLAADQNSSAFEQMAFALEMEPGMEMELEFISLLGAAGEYASALDRLDRLDSRYPENPDLLRTRAVVKLQSGDTEGARTDLFALLADAYFVNECFWLLGQIAAYEGDYLQAIRYFDRVTAGELLISARLASSQTYVALGDLETALRLQREFAEAYPKNAFETFVMRADILLDMNRTDDALALVATAIEYRPWDTSLWMYRGGIYEQNDQLDASIDAFRTAYELEPGNPTVLNALGYTLTNATRNYSEAQGYISKALEQEPDNPAIMDSMGWVLYKQNELEPAHTWLEQAYALMPVPEVAAHLGEVRWERGDEDAAISIWTEALQTDPDDAVLNETINRFLK